MCVDPTAATPAVNVRVVLWRTAHASDMRSNDVDDDGGGDGGVGTHIPSVYDVREE